MKKIAACAFFLLALVPLGGVSGAECARSFGIGIRAGSAFSASGGWTAQSGMREAARVGPDLAFAIERRIGDHVKGAVELQLAWMSFKKGSFPGEAKNPCFSIPAVVFSTRYVFTDNRVRPFLSAGTGIYFWKINTDGPFGGVLRIEGERFEKMSYGLHAGAGAELAASNRLSVSLEARYHFILSRDRFFFGDEFTEQGVLTVAIGASVSFATP